MFKSVYITFILLLSLSVISCGSGGNGSSGSSEDSETSISEVVRSEKIVSTYFSFASLNSDGSVTTWGNSEWGGDSSKVRSQLNNVLEIYSTNSAFAAIKKDGTVVSWGDNGGDSSDIEEELHDISRVVASNGGFAALRNDGKVFTWGYPYNYSEENTAPIISEVTHLAASYSTFSAIKSDGTVVTWGSDSLGSYVPAIEELVNYAPESDILVPNAIDGYAAKLGSGDVVTWGNSASTTGFSPESVINALKIMSSGRGFVALLPSGEAKYWGVQYTSSWSVSPPSSLSNVKDIVFGEWSDAVALLDDGTLVTWGSYGNPSVFPTTWEQLDDFPKTLMNTVEIYKGRRDGSGGSNFGAVDEFGNAYSWGSTPNPDESITNVDYLELSSSAVAALKDDGKVVYWGRVEVEFDLDTLKPLIDPLLVDVEAIYSSGVSFSAIRSDGSIVTWGKFVNDGIVEF